jgi:hypothetical protein
MVVVEAASAARDLGMSILAHRQVIIKEAGLEANHLDRGRHSL